VDVVHVLEEEAQEEHTNHLPWLELRDQLESREEVRMYQ
jgi:hypothetical protein